MTEDNDEGGPTRPTIDKVGYCRAPKQHRFRKGEPSPNPFGRRGKPKGNSELDEKDFLKEKIRISMSGKWTWITRDEYINLTLFARIKGDEIKASKRLDERVEMGRRRDAEKRHLTSIAQATLAKDEADDKAIIARALARRADRQRTAKQHVEETE